MNLDWKCGQALRILLLTSSICGCAIDMHRDGVKAAEFSRVYVGMPRSKFEDIVGRPIEQSKTYEILLATYEYDRGYIGCVTTGRCPEVSTGAEIGGKTAEGFAALGTMGLSEWGIWKEVHDCQTGYLRASYGPDGRLINIKLLNPQPYKTGTYYWDRDSRKPRLNYPCREIYDHPQQLTIPDAVLDVDSGTPD